MQRLDPPNTQKNRVAYLVGGLRISLGEGSTTPGPRNHILNFTEALRKSGQDVDFFLASNTRLLSRLSKVPEGAASNRSKMRTILSDIMRLLAMIYAGLSVAAWSRRREEPAWIYERLAVMQSLSTFHRYKRSAVRVVESNGIMSRETAKDRGALLLEPLARRIEIHVYRRADLIVAVSQALAEEIAAFAGISEEKIIVIPNAIPFNMMRFAPLEAPTTRIVVGFTGAVVEWQQLDLLIRALADVNPSTMPTPISVEIIGDGPCLEELKYLAENLGVGDQVVFLGKLSPDNVISRMSSWSVGYSGHKRSSGEKMYHSPLKLYEYAGSGLGALCTPSDDAIALSDSGMPLWTFQTEQELRAAIENIAASREQLSKYRSEGYRDVRKSHSWNSRLETLFTAITKL